MIPQIGQKVRCIVSTNSSTLEVEGIVEHWGAEVVLKLLDNQKIVIIHKVSDIVLTEVLLKDESLEIEPLVPIKKRIKEKLKDIQISSSDDIGLEQQSINDLKKLATQHEQENIERLKKEHFGSPASPKITYYGSQLPILMKKG